MATLLAVRSCAARVRIIPGEAFRCTDVRAGWTGDVQRDHSQQDAAFLERGKLDTAGHSWI